MTIRSTRSNLSYNNLAAYVVYEGGAVDSHTPVRDTSNNRCDIPNGERGASSIRSFWLLETSFPPFHLYQIGVLCSFIMFLVFDTHATLADGK